MTLRCSGALAFLAESTLMRYVSCRSQMDTNSVGSLLEVALVRVPGRRQTVRGEAGQLRV